MHPSIVLDEANEMLLGVSDVHIWNRSHSKADKHARNYSKQPIEEKESNRWVASTQQPVAGNISLTIRNAQKRQDRQVTLAIRYTTAHIAQSQHRPSPHLLEYIELYAIEVCETTDTVPTGEKPVR